MLEATPTKAFVLLSLLLYNLPEAEQSSRQPSSYFFSFEPRSAPAFFSDLAQIESDCVSFLLTLGPPWARLRAAAIAVVFFSVALSSSSWLLLLVPEMRGTISNWTHFQSDETNADRVLALSPPWTIEEGSSRWWTRESFRSTVSYYTSSRQVHQSESTNCKLKHATRPTLRHGKPPGPTWLSQSYCRV